MGMKINKEELTVIRIGLNPLKRKLALSIGIIKKKFKEANMTSLNDELVLYAKDDLCVTSNVFYHGTSCNRRCN